MRSVTVITAAHPAAYPYLRAAAESLTWQRTGLRWVVVADDDDTTAAARALDGTPASLLRATDIAATGRVGSGAAAARTLALTGVDTRWLSVLDADDQWEPGGIDTLLAHCEWHAATWATGHSHDLAADGTVVPYPALPTHLADRTCVPGELWDTCLSLIPWVQAALVADTHAVTRLGGWPAFPCAEDSGLTLALVATQPGHVSSATVYRYRKWPGQVSARLSRTDIERWHAIAARRAHRLRAGLAEPAAPGEDRAIGEARHLVDDDT